MLEHGSEKHRKVVAKILRSDLLSFAKHRNASYLVEKALSYCHIEASSESTFAVSKQDQRALLAQLGRTEVILDLARPKASSL